MTKILIATKNAGKIKEIERSLEKLPVDLQSLDNFPEIVEPQETGATFMENAILKARFYAEQTGIRALADDSGLEVEALHGAPGVLSARYAGENADDARRIEKLLNELNESPAENRRARFVCAMAIADAKGEVLFTATGVCDGRIAGRAGGTNGFGYDPVFIPDGFSNTFGELDTATKQRLSHRARATGEIIQYLRHFYAAPS